MKNKKRGASSKTWAIDCRMDGAFDFALKVLREAKDTKKYSLHLRINFIKIAYSNSLETIAKAQTDPKEFKLKTAVKLFNSNLSEISKVAKEMLDDPVVQAISSSVGLVRVNSSRVISTIYNPHDFIDIDYDQIKHIITSLRFTNHNTRGDEKAGINIDSRTSGLGLTREPMSKDLLSCATRYNFPKIIEEFSQDINDMKITCRLMPTNDIVVSIPYRIWQLFQISINTVFDTCYPEGTKSKLDSIKWLINNGSKPDCIIPGARLIHTPYDSFDSIINLLEHAAESPENVNEIGITIYRLSPNSKIIDNIITAANNGIHCKIYIELSARGEIDQDLQYLVTLLDQGAGEFIDVKVQYNGIKVHGKMMYISLKNGAEIGVFSTGNYNETTARIYKDYHYVTCNKNVVGMIKQNFTTLWNSDQPVMSSISNVLSKEIYQEIAKGKNGKIWIQTNHLDNKHIVNLLREAIRRECDVRLIVRTTRGFHNRELKNCKTIVGKYLEHARVYIFGDGDDRRVYLSSSDILFRNLYNRFESYVKITDGEIEHQLIEDFRSLYKNGQR